MQFQTVLASTFALAILVPAAYSAHITPAQAKTLGFKKVPGMAHSVKYEFKDGPWHHAVH